MAKAKNKRKKTARKPPASKTRSSDADLDALTASQKSVEKIRRRVAEDTKQVKQHTERRKADVDAFQQANRRALSEARDAVKAARKAERAAQRAIAKLHRVEAGGVKTRRKTLKGLESEIRERVEAERRSRIKPERLRQHLITAQRKVDRIEEAIAKVKAETAELKNEISTLKLTYQGQVHDDVEQAWSRVHRRRNALAKRIETRHARRTKLEADKLRAMGHLEELRARLAALDEGVHERPIEQDARLRNIKHARQTD